MIAHVGIPGPAPFIAVGLFLTAMGAGFGAYSALQHRPSGRRRVIGIGLAVLAAASLASATVLPLVLHANVGFTRPSTRARLEIVSPRQGEVMSGDPATVVVRLSLSGGTIVPFSSLRLVPNEGHIHLYLDGRLTSMTTALEAQVVAAPGPHSLRAEFVAVDHGPFQPRVLATVTFVVRP